MTKQVARYAALDEQGWVITKVLAADADEARREITRQLDRPGRREYYRRWVQGGKQIKRL